MTDGQHKCDGHTMNARNGADLRIGETGYAVEYLNTSTGDGDIATCQGASSDYVNPYPGGWNNIVRTLVGNCRCTAIDDVSGRATIEIIA